MKKNKKKKQESTYFALQGSIRTHSGSLFSLYSQIDEDEWQCIVSETVRYKVFLECLKDFAFEKLDEQWTTDDNQYLIYLIKTVEEIKKIGPLLYTKQNEPEIKKQYILKMSESIIDLKSTINSIADDIVIAKTSKTAGPAKIDISDL